MLVRSAHRTGSEKFKMKFVPALAIAAGLLVSGQAYSADLPARPYYKAAPVAYLPWNKCYVGVTLGYTKSTDSDAPITSTDPNFLLSQTLGNVPTRLSSEPDGVIGGGTIGCDRQYDRIVVGVLTDISASSLRDTTSVTQGPAVVTTSLTRELDVLGTLRGRLGYAIDNTLIYATGGLAYGHLKSSASITTAVVGAPILAGSQDEWRGGWTVGGGIEHMFAPNWSVKGEYLYYDLGTTDIALLTIAGAPNETGVISHKNTGHIIRAGLNYHFSAF